MKNQRLIDLREKNKTRDYINEVKPKIVFHLAADATEGRSQFTPISCTERNYLAQKLMDEYNANAERGNTLYGRQYQAGQDAYNRANTAVTQYDQDRLNNLLRGYDSYANLYGLNYGAGLDLAKIGAGQAGAAGSSSIQTGQNVAQGYNQIGDTQANAGMASTQTT